jgi:plastocyanin
MKRNGLLLLVAVFLIIFPSATAFAQPGLGISILQTVQRPDPTFPQAIVVNLSGTGFNPPEVTIEAGSSVTFQNQTGKIATLKDGTPRFLFLPSVIRTNPATADQPLLPATPAYSPNGSGIPIPVGGSTTQAFPTAGTYDFYHQENARHTVRVIVKDFSLTPTPLTRSINATQQTTYTLTLAALNGFNSSLTLSVSGLPTGASAQWSANPVSLPAAPILTITTTVTTPAGDYPLTLSATNGTLTHTTQITLTILPWPNLAVTALSLTPDPVTVGASVTLNTTISNLGPGNADAFTATWQVSTDAKGVLASGSWPVNSLANGAHADLSAPFTPTQPGPYQVTVQADPTSALPDPDRTNNTRSLTVQFKDFTLAAAEPHSRTVYATQSASYIFNTTALNGFARPVTLSITGLPAGVTPTWDPNPSIPPAAQGLTLATTAATPPGSYDLTVSGTDGFLTHTAAITLVVNARPDLSITTITFDPDPAITGQAFTLSAQVVNLSTGPALPFNVTWEIVPFGQTTPVLNGSWEVNSLAGSANTTLTANPTIPLPGPYTVTVVADSGLALPDPDRTNNTRQVELGVSGPINVCANITTNTTWAYATYVITCDITVNPDITLTVRDGAVVKFHPGPILWVSGMLDVDGTTSKPIAFTSFKDDTYGGDSNSDGNASTPAPGDWVAISINPTGSATFEHAIVRYAGTSRSGISTESIRVTSGSIAFNHSTLEQGNGIGINVESNGSLNVSDAILRDNKGDGIRFFNDTRSSAPVIANTAFNNNLGFAVYTNLNTVTFDGSGIQNNTFSGNNTNGIRLGAIFTGASTLSGNAGLPYVINSDTTVANPASLTIAAGAVIKLSGGAGALWVNGGLTVNGIEGNPVVFTSLRDDTYGGNTNQSEGTAAPASGDWLVIGVTATGNATFDHAVVRYGGQSRSGVGTESIRVISGSITFNHSTLEQGNGIGLNVLTNGNLSVSDSIIQGNKGDGIRFADTSRSSAPLIANTAFNNNQGFAVYATLDTVTFDGSGIQNNTFSGNTTNGIRLGAIFTGASTLSGNAGLPYVINSDTTVANPASLTIAAGAVLKLSGGAGALWVDGTLTVNGVAGNPVVFTSLRDDAYGGNTNESEGPAAAAASGDWLVIGVTATGNATFDHAVVRYGGQSRSGVGTESIRAITGTITFNHSTLEQGNGIGLNVLTNGNLSVSDSIFQNNKGDGIRFVNDNRSSAPVIANTTFNNNLGFAVYTTLDTVTFDGAGIHDNTFSANGTNGIRLGAIFTGASTLSGNAGLPYVIHSDTTVSAGNSLTIAAGAVIKLSGGSGALWVNGTLTVNGVTETPVVFTSLRDDTYGGDTNNDGSASAPAPGDWLIIGVTSTGTANFEHAVVRYAGQSRPSVGYESIRVITGSITFNHSILEQGNGIGLNIEANGNLSVSNSTIQDNKSHGIRLVNTSPSSAPVIANTAFNNNKGLAVSTELSNVTFNGAGIHDNTATGNNTNGIGLAAIFSGDAGTSTLSGNAGMPYVITSDATINNKHTLTIGAGAVIKLSGGSGVLWVNGTLTVNGVEGNPVVFTSLKDDTYGGNTNLSEGAVTPAPGDWLAIGLSSTGSATFEHAVVRYAGQSRSGIGTESIRVITGSIIFNHSILEQGNGIGLNVESNGNLSVSNSTIRDNKGTGIRFANTSRSSAPVIANTAFNNNKGLAVSAELSSIAFDGSGIHDNTFSGNNTNGIGLAASFTGTSTLSGNAGMPYVISSDSTVTIGQSLTIAGGAVIKLSGGSGALWVDGTLNANGISGSPVVFTSLKDDTYGGDTNNDAGASSPAPGDWLIIGITSTGTATFEQAVVRYAGQSRSGVGTESIRGITSTITFNHSTIEHGNGIGLNLTSNSNLSVSDSVIQDNKGDGIRFADATRSSAPVIANTAFNRNLGFAVYAELNSVTFDGSDIQNNTFSANGTNGIRLGAIFTGASKLSGNAGLPYVISSDSTVSNGSSLAIAAGAVIKLSGGSGALWVDGTLNVNGVAGNPVIFTSLRDDTYGGDTNNDGALSSPERGDWLIIGVTASGTANFEYAVVRYAGASRSGVGTESIRTLTGSIVFNHSTLEQGNGAGINVATNGNLSVGHSTIRNNTGAGIYLGSSGSAPTLDHVIFNANATGLQVSGSVVPLLTACSFVGNTSYGLYNDSGIPVNATNSWWGNASGPYHATLNPTGTGDVVSNNVTFNPWLLAQP